MTTPQSSFLCARNGDTVGPYTLQQLRSMWSSGQFTADTVYWAESDSAWLPLRALLESNPCESNTNPAPPSEPQPLTPAAAPKASPTQSRERSPFAPQQIKDGFGFSADTPIPASSIPLSRRYFDLLATPDFERITYTRVGSFDSTATKHLVDGYDLFDKEGRFIYRVFINAYAGKDTERAPEGLQYWHPSKGFTETKMGQRILQDLKADPKIKKILEKQKRANKSMNDAIRLMNEATGLGGQSRKGCLGVILLLVVAIPVLLLILSGLAE